MPAIGLGNRKAMTPRSSKAPRRSLPPTAKLIEAESLSPGASSPDIMTTKLHEKVKATQLAKHKPSSKKENFAAPRSQAISFNDRLNAAAASSNRLEAQAGRSKLSLEEVHVASDSSDAEPSMPKAVGPASLPPQPKPASVNTLKGSLPTKTPSFPQSDASSYHKTLNNPTVSSRYQPMSTASAPSWYNDPLSAQGPSAFNTSGSSFESAYSSGALGSNVEAMLLNDQLTHVKRDYDALKQRFAELNRLRSTDAEAALEEYKRRSDARDLAANKALQALQTENEKLKKLLAEANSSRASHSNSDNNLFTLPKPSIDTASTKELERLIKIYAGFSGLRLECVSTPTAESEQYEWACEFAGRNGRFSFALIYDPSLQRYQYLPTDSLAVNLPPFLASDILITPDQMQIFFWRMLDSLTKLK